MTEWISVEERLPQQHARVAVLISDTDVAIVNYPTCARMDIEFRGAENERRIWWAGVPGNYMRIPDDGWTVHGWRVTHWMPLPDPPTKVPE